MSVALSACSLCINRRLYFIARIGEVTTTKKDKRRAVRVDLAIGIGIPVLVMVLRMFLYFLASIHFFFSDRGSQTTSFKVIVSTFSKIMDVPLPSIILGPRIPSFICHLYSLGSFPPPTPS